MGSFSTRRLWRSSWLAEVPVPTRYFPQASSASFVDSSIYGTKILLLLMRYQLHRFGIMKYRAMDSLARRYAP